MLQSWKELMALSLTPQAMCDQFKRPSAGSVRELYYIYRKTSPGRPSGDNLKKKIKKKNNLRNNESRDHYHADGYVVPSPRYDFHFEAVSRLLRPNSVYLANAILPFGHSFFSLIV